MPIKNPIPVGPEDRSKVFDAAYVNQAVGAWHDESTKIVAFYEKHDEPYRLRLAYRNFGPYSYSFDSDVDVKNGDWTGDAPAKAVSIEARPEELRRSIEVFLSPIGEMRPVDVTASVVTNVVLSPSEGTKAHIPSAIPLAMILDPGTYECVCC
jgi:hypothetical protein